MMPRSSAPWTVAGCLAALIGVSTVGCFLAPCDEPATPVRDGSHREREVTQPPENPPALRDVEATLADGELTIRYVQDADGRIYEVRLREVE